MYFCCSQYLNSLKNNAKPQMLYHQHLLFFFHLNMYDLIKKKKKRKFLQYKYSALADFLLLIVAKTEEETFPDRYIKPCLEV